MDFYWHYSGKDTIDQAGKDSFCRAIMVAAQVFAAITEYIQVGILHRYDCIGHSRIPPWRTSQGGCHDTLQCILG